MILLMLAYCIKMNLSKFAWCEESFLQLNLKDQVHGQKLLTVYIFNDRKQAEINTGANCRNGHGGIRVRDKSDQSQIVKVSGKLIGCPKSLLTNSFRLPSHVK